MFSLCPRFGAISATDEHLDSSNHTQSTEEVVDLKGDQFEDTAITRSLNLNYRDLFALALTTSIGGHYLNWNAGLTAGFGTYFIATVVIASGYICLLLCLSELASALPFAGGAYGIARVTLGIFPGYLVACLDSYKSVLYVASAAGSIGHMLTDATGLPRSLEPVYWLVFYVVSLCIHSYGGKVLWRFINGLAMLSVFLMVMYILGSIPFANLAQNAPLEDETNSPYEQWFHGGMYEFMHILPTPCWFYVGIQSINVACGELLKPKSDVPRGYCAAMATTICTSFTVLLIACSLSPGVPVLISRIHPLTRGYMKMFAIKLSYARLISLPATVASGFGFMYIAGQQLRAMGMSGLINPVCAKELPGRGTPVGALVTSSVFGYALCLLVFYKPGIREFTYNISMLGAFGTYLSVFLSFWMFRHHYPTITREFVSPLGISGAVYGFLVFLLAIISICGFQKTQIAICTFAVLSTICTVYYFAVVRHRQVFSEEEKTVLFKAYLIKGNTAKASRIRKGREASAAAGGSAHGSSHGSAHGMEMGQAKGIPLRKSAAPPTPTSTATVSGVVVGVMKTVSGVSDTGSAERSVRLPMQMHSGSSDRQGTVVEGCGPIPEYAGAGAGQDEEMTFRQAALSKGGRSEVPDSVVEASDEQDQSGEGPRSMLVVAGRETMGDVEMGGGGGYGGGDDGDAKQ